MLNGEPLRVLAQSFRVPRALESGTKAGRNDARRERIFVNEHTSQRGNGVEVAPTATGHGGLTRGRRFKRGDAKVFVTESQVD